MDSQENQEATEQRAHNTNPSGIAHHPVECQTSRDDSAIPIVEKPAAGTESEQHTNEEATESKENVPILPHSPEPPAVQSKTEMDLDGFNDLYAGLGKPKNIVNLSDIKMNKGLISEYKQRSTTTTGDNTTLENSTEDDCAEGKVIPASDISSIETESTSSDDTDRADNELQRTSVDRTLSGPLNDFPDQAPHKRPTDEAATSTSYPQYYSDSDSGTSSSRYDSPIPLPDVLTRRILEKLSVSDLRSFATTSRASYITALPILARCVILPLPDESDDINTALATDISNYVR
ncbi:hypothetical protein AA313_de0209371 [Arthrobotrys entomopaga]|nr:hypothetical protein AA313_de0209371 [Arthrobotrys entomopaga]